MLDKDSSVILVEARRRKWSRVRALSCAIDRSDSDDPLRSSSVSLGKVSMMVSSCESLREQRARINVCSSFASFHTRSRVRRAGFRSDRDSSTMGAEGDGRWHGRGADNRAGRVCVARSIRESVPNLLPSIGYRMARRQIEPQVRRRSPNR